MRFAGFLVVSDFLDCHGGEYSVVVNEVVVRPLDGGQSMTARISSSLRIDELLRRRVLIFGSGVGREEDAFLDFFTVIG